MNHLSQIADKLSQYDLDAMLIVSEPGERYAVGFQGEGYVLVTREGSQYSTDGRYIEAAQKQVTGGGGGPHLPGAEPPGAGQGFPGGPRPEAGWALRAPLSAWPSTRSAGELPQGMRADPGPGAAGRPAGLQR